MNASAAIARSRRQCHGQRRDAEIRSVARPMAHCDFAGLAVGNVQGLNARASDEYAADSTNSGDGQQRVVAAMGTARTMNYTSRQFEDGPFFWASADTEGSRAFNLFSKLSVGESTKFLVDLNKFERLNRFLDNATVGNCSLHFDSWIQIFIPGALTPDLRGGVWAMVEEALENPIETLMLATKERYDVDCGGTNIVEVGMTRLNWADSRLRETDLVLDHREDSRPRFSTLRATTKAGVLHDKALHAVGVGLSGAWNPPHSGVRLGTLVEQDPLYQPCLTRADQQARSDVQRRYRFLYTGERIAERYAWSALRTKQYRDASVAALTASR